MLTTILIATMLQSDKNITNKLNTLKQNKDVVVKTFTKKANAVNYIENLKDKPVVMVKRTQTQSLQKPLNYSDIVGGSYNKGLKYYGRYIYRKIHIRSTTLLYKILNVQMPNQLKPLFANNAQGLIKKLQKKGNIYDDFVNGIKKIRRMHKLNDLYQFFIGILNGKIPASCGW